MSRRESSPAGSPPARGGGPRTPEPATERHRTTAAEGTPRGAGTNGTETAAGNGPMPAISSPDMIFREVVQGLCKGSYVPGQRRVGEAVLSSDMRRAELAARRHVRNTSAVLNQVADG